MLRAVSYTHLDVYKRQAVKYADMIVTMDADLQDDINAVDRMICLLYTSQVGGINKEYDGAQDYDFILRCTELADNVIHIPKVLYHWRVHERSTAAGCLLYTSRCV